MNKKQNKNIKQHPENSYEKLVAELQNIITKTEETNRALGKILKGSEYNKSLDYSRELS